MSFIAGLDERQRSSELGFKRHLFVPGVIIAVAELLLVALPLWKLFDLGEVAPSVLWRVAIPTLTGAALTWLAIVAMWLAPIQRAVQAQRRHRRVPDALAASAYLATLRVPFRVLIARSVIWATAALIISAFLVRYADWTWPRCVQMTSLAGLHAFCVNLIRAVWSAGILAELRAQLFPGRAVLQRFADEYFSRLILVAAVVVGGTVIALSAFLYYLLPIGVDRYLGIQTYLSPALGLGLLVWTGLARRLTRKLETYFQVAVGAGDSSSRPTAIAVYRRAQALPYYLALIGLATWTVSLLGGAWVARTRLRFQADDTVVMLGTSLMLAVGAALYQWLWHRETMRELLAYLTVHHRLPLGTIRPSMSLRGKLLLSFGGVVFFACGIALCWGFVQYKKLASDFALRQAGLGLQVLRSEVNAAAAAGDQPPSPELVETTLGGIDARRPPTTTSAVYYYYLPNAGERPTGVIAGTAGAPTLPWFAAALMSQPG
ncbi:MAG: hypothetical protein AAGC55_22665, partial [Myxococcota bacterium]